MGTAHSLADGSDYCGELSIRKSSEGRERFETGDSKGM